MVTVRPATPEDAPTILDAHVASIRAFGPRTYDDRQVAAWATKDGPEQYPIEDDDQYLVVAEVAGHGGTADELAGFGAVDLDDGEVWAVYVHPDHARAGVGSALLADLEETAREDGFESLTLVASLNAVGFYERHGWKGIEEVTIENTGGVEMDCLVMRKEFE